MISGHQRRDQLRGGCPRFDPPSGTRLSGQAELLRLRIFDSRPEFCQMSPDQLRTADERRRCLHRRRLDAKSRSVVGKSLDSG